MAGWLFKRHAGLGLLIWAYFSHLGFSAPAVPECRSYIQGQIEEGLRNIGEQSAARSGLVDITLPTDRSQYEGLNKSALVAVTVFSKNKMDLPIDAIYFAYKEDGKYKRAVFKPLFKKPMLTEMGDKDPVGLRFGRFRQDSFAMVPLWLLRLQGELGVRFADKDSHLPLVRTPLATKLPQFVTKDPKARESGSKTLDDALIHSLLKQNYCITAGRAG